ncbi:phage late control D family protein [Leptolyngbya sp. AN02str]|uniref:phage late control D family protein n=1 Tax=Leptolyngbya sp. AN02str TaxID=3423363 RepID=UPI003D312020
MIRYPTFKLVYEGTDITEGLKPFVLSISYSDKLEGESDELEIALENSDLRWMGTWLPKEGDAVSLELGYDGGVMLGPILFEVDEPEFSGPPDVIRLKGLATPVTASLRQRNSAAYENTTLLAIAQQIAQKHKLELVGEVPEIKLERVTQKEQTDLEFLREIAADYGLIFKVESSTKLVFFRESDLEAADPVLTFTRQDIGRYRIRRGAKGTYQAAEISYNDPKTGKLISVKIDAAGKEVATPAGGKTEVASGDILKIRERCENRAQAEVKATEALRRANRGQVEGTLDMEGNTSVVAGLNLTLNGFLNLSGKYQVKQVRHSLSRSKGYTSNVEITGLELEGEPEQ